MAIFKVSEVVDVLRLAWPKKEEPKMSSDVSSITQESPTTLRLMPTLMPGLLAQDKSVIGVIEFRHGWCHVMGCVIDAGKVRCPLATHWHTWNKDGTSRNTSYALLAWRKHDGPWHVIDSRVTPLLPKIDEEITA